MVFLVTCKNEDPIKNEEPPRVSTALNIDFFKTARAGNSVVRSRKWLKFKLIQAFVHVLVSCKNEETNYKGRR